MRTVGWFSAGAASAIACRLAKPNIIAYCDTSSEDSDNHRFLRDCENRFGWQVLRLKNPDYVDTWDVWQKKRYISGIAGAPCTSMLKIKPRLEFQLPDDVHIFGFTADSADVKRATMMREHYPELTIECPLIDRGLDKKACLALLETAGIAPPAVYAKGFRNANCIPCCKATSPDYWALVRKEYPTEFWRMASLSRELGARLTRINGSRAFIDEIPDTQPASTPVSPECDFLCQLVDNEIGGIDDNR